MKLEPVSLLSIFMGFISSFISSSVWQRKKKQIVKRELLNLENSQCASAAQLTRQDASPKAAVAVVFVGKVELLCPARHYL